MSFLHAQDGVFLFDSAAGTAYFSAGKWQPFESAITDGWEQPQPAIVRLTLARNRVEELDRLLWRERISRAHLMPTLDNVTQTLVAKWRRAASNWEQFLANTMRRGADDNEELEQRR